MAGDKCVCEVGEIFTLLVEAWARMVGDVRRELGGGASVREVIEESARRLIREHEEYAG